jgi:hypothetical protein
MTGQVRDPGIRILQLHRARRKRLACREWTLEGNRTAVDPIFFESPPGETDYIRRREIVKAKTAVKP